jgi:hypothetical protein
VKESKARKRKRIHAETVIAIRVKNGTMPHAWELTCADCGGQARDYHHEDYDKPMKVVPLCRSCHKKRHRQ